MSDPAPASARPAPFIATEIACYPMVRKFLARNYSVPFVVSARQNAYSNFLAACLDRNPSHRKYIPIDELTDRLPIRVGAWRHKCGFGKVLTPEAVLMFNRFVLEALMDRIMVELVLAHLNGKSVLQSAQSIISRYGLTDQELTVEGILSYYVLHQAEYEHLSDEFVLHRGAKKVHLSEPTRRRNPNTGQVS